MYELRINEGGMGNCLGEFFEAVSCANIAGLHFVPFAINDAYKAYHFTKELHKIIVHPNPVKSKAEAIKNIKASCIDTEFPWQNGNTLVIKNIPQVRQLFSNALHFYMAQEFHHSFFNSSAFTSMKYPNTLNINGTSVIQNATYPIIPDVTILFRCSDILHHGTKEIHSPYGFLNFNVYRLLIPSHVKHIYIISEKLNYGSNGEMCINIGDRLIEFLSQSFPDAHIGMRRGHAWENLVLLTKSPISICVPSTFCIWPGIGRKPGEGILYYKKTGLCLAGKPEVSDIFNWINYPPLVQFGDHPEVFENNDMSRILNFTKAMDLLTKFN
eukprot:gene13790-18497_t